MAIILVDAWFFKLCLELADVMLDDGTDELGVKLIAVGQKELELRPRVFNRLTVFVNENHQLV